MGKAAGCSPCGGCGKCGTGSSARAGAAGHYRIARMPSTAFYSGGGIDLFKAWREMRRDGAHYEVGTRGKPYERLAPLEKSAYDAMAAMASVDYGGKRALYSINIARGAGKGYGIPIKVDPYQTPNIVNIADHMGGVLDNAYRREADQAPNIINLADHRKYSQAA